MADFRVLGPLSIERSAAKLPRMLRRLLATLLCRAGRAVSSDELIVALWGEGAPPTARKTLQVYVRRLRATIGDDRAIRHEAGGYRIVVAWERLDAARFAHLIEAARRAEPERAVDLIDEALHLWRGPAYEDVRDYAPAADEAQRLDEERLRAECDRAALLLELGRHVELIPRLLNLTRQHPYREDLRGHLMLALYRHGRSAEALETFADTQKALANDLRAEPGPQLKQLHQAILRADPALLGPRTGVIPGPVPRQLPAAPSGFVGRVSELRTLDAIASAPVIVTGTAGVGKTALVLRWAHSAAGRFPDGQLYVNLNGFSASPPAKPVEALALMLRAINVPPEKVPVGEAEAAGLFRTLMTERRALVVLDNAISADQVRPLLAGGRGNVTVVTSRRNLSGLLAHEGARRINLDVLEDEDAVALLSGVIGEERVAAEPQAGADLARLCAHLPLALRVAAAHLNDSPHRRLADQVAALSGGDPLVSLAIEDDERSAVRAAIDLSYRDIPGDTRRTFRLLGLVPGPDFSAPAVAALTGQAEAQAERQLARLADAHLIERAGPERFTFHELLRRYAREKTTAQERDTAIERLFGWYVESVYAATDVMSPNLVRMPLDKPYPRPFETVPEALAWLDAERSNLIAAIHRAAKHGPFEASWLLAGAMRGYLARRKFFAEWSVAATVALEAAVAHGGRRAQAAAHLTLAHAHRTRLRYEDALRHLRTAFELAKVEGWLDMQASTMMNSGGIHYDVGVMADAVRTVRKAYELFVRIGSRHGTAAALGNTGAGLYHSGRLSEASKILSRAIRLDRELGMELSEASAMGDLGVAVWHLGRPAAGHRLLIRAIRIKIAGGDRLGESLILAELAEFYRQHGFVREGMGFASRALQLAKEVGDALAESMGLVAVGGMHLAAGNTLEANRCHLLARQVASAVGVRLPQAAAMLGLAEAHLAFGEQDSAEEAAKEALALTRLAGYRLREGVALTLLAKIRLAAGGHEEAMKLARGALEIHRETGYRHGAAQTLALLANLEDDPATSNALRAQANDIARVIRLSAVRPYEYQMLADGRPT